MLSIHTVLGTVFCTMEMAVSNTDLMPGLRTLKTQYPISSAEILMNVRAKKHRARC